MDYKDFTKRQVAYDGFIRVRKKVLSSVDSGNFSDVFNDVCSDAMAGDCIAQDVVAYFFNKGVEGFLPVNYELYMSWEILAGANGNEFALEKLEFFMNYSLEIITENEELLTFAMEKGNITKNNAIMVISNLICEAIADQLKLDAKKLVEIPVVRMPYSTKANRKFLDALQSTVVDVAKVLLA